MTYVLDSTVWGGAETYVARLVRELVGRVRPVVVTPRPVPQRLLDALPAGTELHTVDGVGRKADLRGLARLVAAVRATEPDVVHVNQSTPVNNRYGLLAARLSGAVPLATVHSPEPVRSRTQVRLLPLLYRGVHTVVAVSDQTRDILVDSLRVPPARVRVALNGVPVPDVPPGRPDAGGDGIRVGSLGRLVKEKAFDVLVDAFALVDHRDPPVHLRIGGEGPERAELESRARGLPVSFVGDVVDTAAFLQELGVFCLSSRREGLPFALLEAMALGIPCIATDVGQVRSALGEAVLVVPPEQPHALAEALRHLLDDPAARTSLGARGRALVEERHDVRLMATSMLELYETAVTRPHRGGLRSRRP
ncbi:glycosyltransferase family 4 protein [Geodermatophilus saharensis]|uniref:glycosyltransferase family 4 protein n=1 Tax=Geodermatophilus saharensis TaxID=1137994 RepID=UPI0015963CE6|nr:glycosyltransferase family 4 protein [Geodermatophilus saharensis]